MSLDLAPFKALIYNHCGLVLEGIAEDRLNKALNQAVIRLGCRDLNDYFRLLENTPEQFEQLISALTVNETYFFREPDQIALFTNQLIPRLLARQSRRPLRILSAGCSSGEEPYSLAMALDTVYGEQRRQLFKIDAGDVDRQVLSKARQGIYSAFSFRSMDPVLQQRYFRPIQRNYQLVDEIRQSINFLPLNLKAPLPPQGLEGYDLIFCRNVSIYFDPETRQMIHRRFHDVLNENGILLLGSSETLGNDLGVFELVEEHGHYYFIKGEAYRPPSSQAVSWSSLHSASTAVQLGKESLCDPEPSARVAPDAVTPALLNLPPLDSIRQLVQEGEREKASELLDRHLRVQNQPVAMGVLLLKSWLLLNQRAFHDADGLLDQVLHEDPWSVDGLLLKGLNAKWQNRLQEACDWFRKVTYTCPECWPAHYYLAETYRIQGHDAAAIKAYQVIRRILSNDKHAADGMLWVPLPLPRGDILFLSERHLLKLKQNTQLSDKGEG
ncbi:CheR family methyltransferase [Nitrincola iocasae]|uniref:protein-glutamate O-methyltransferase n=1 Tax=Nitrincola iocasae TaxID=2614693 RepID=A0A5J6LID7_9GAMM|nr:CheR family methyltransferase [Nitrincola iocasae]QEW08133.1 protein-glutamate O-methyltransferase CheR [Nitrincola iocasae]